MRLLRIFIVRLIFVFLFVLFTQFFQTKPVQGVYLSNTPSFFVEQNLAWGVLAVNTNKNVYQPGERAKISLAVLDEKGKMVCDAKIELRIKNKELGINDLLSTENNRVVVNPECQIYDLVSRPDFEAEYLVKEVGKYEMELIAQTKNGRQKMTGEFEVSEFTLFEIERETATRIYPAKDYRVTIKVKANQDFQGVVEEEVPAGFKVSDSTAKDNRKIISWPVDWKKGKEYVLSYTYDAPEISPEYYSLGPLLIKQPDNSIVYSEQKVWQIASDAAPTYVSAGTIVADTSQDCSITPSPPTHSVDDILVCTAINEGGGALGTITSDWVEINEIDGTNNIAWYWKRATATNDAGPNITAADTDCFAVCYAINGVTTGTPFEDATTAGDGTTADNNPDTATITTTDVDRMVVSLLAVGDDTAWTTPPAPTDWASDSDLTSGSGTDARFTFIHINKSTAGDVNTAQIGTISATELWGSLTLAFIPIITRSITGTVYDTTEGSVVASGPLVRVKVDGLGDYSATANGSGVYNVTGIVMEAGSSLTVYLDTGGGITGATFTRSTGADMTNIHIYQDRATTRCDNSSCSLTNTDINDWDKSNDGDIHAASDGTDLTVDNDWKLLVVANTFAPGGTVTTTVGGSNTYSGDVEIKTGAVLNMNGSALSIGGVGSTTSRPLLVSGTYTTGSNTTTFTGGSASDLQNMTYYNLTINGTGPFSLIGATTVDGNLTISSGTLNTSASGNYTVTLNGGFSNSGTFTANASNVVIGGTSATPSIAGFTTTGTLSFTRTSSTATLAGNVSVASLTMNGSGGTLNLGVSLSHSISGAVTLTAGILNGGSSTLTLTGNWSGDATFTGNGSTVNFNGSSQTLTCTASTFYNLTITSSTSTSSTFTVGNDLTVNGTLTVSSGTGTITVNGDVTGSGTISMSAGTLDQNVSAASVFGSSSNSNNWTFNNLTFSNSSSAGAGTAVKINDASNFGGFTTTSRQVVRTSGGTLYALVIDDANDDLEVWSSTDGSSWTEQDSTDGPTSVSGVQAAVAIDSAGVLHIAYASSSSAISYTSFNTATNQFSGSIQEIFSETMIGSVDITVDSSNYPHIVSAINGSLSLYIYYRNQTGGVWRSTVTVNSIGGPGTFPFESPSISIDSNGYPQISYISVSDNNLVAELGNANNATSFYRKSESSVNNTANQLGSSLAIDSSGNTWIAFVDGTTNYITLNKFSFGGTWTDAGSWSQYTNSNAGYEPSIVINGTDVYVFYQDSSDNYIKYDRYNGSWLGETTLESSTYQDVKARWASLYNPSYSTYGIDYLFSDGIDVYWNKISFSSPVTITANTGGTGSVIVTGSLQIGKTNDVGTTTLNNETYDRIIDVNGNFNVTSKGIYSASSSQNLTVAGNFTNSGIFTANSGRVVFDGGDSSTQIITGATSFYDLSATTAANSASRTLQFTHTTTYTVTHDLTLNGTSCSVLLLLRSSSINTQWSLDDDTGGTTSVNYVDVQDSIASDQAITAAYGINSGNNSYWTITSICGGNSAPTAPTLLFVNELDASVGVAAPSAVGNSTPVFSAINNDTDDGDVADYYQIIVYSGTGCSSQLWDSTKISMANCTENTRCLTVTGFGIEYGTTALRFDGKQYSWKIKFWDDSAAEGAFSDCNSFYILGPNNQKRHGLYFFNRTTKRSFTW